MSHNINKKIVIVFLTLFMFVQGCVRTNNCLLAQANHPVAGLERGCDK